MEVEISSVLIYLAVILLSARLGGELFSRLKQPPVVGELISGIMIGPFVAGQISNLILGHHLFINLDSPSGSVVNVFSDIGIILLLFLAGVSIDIDEFKKSGKVAIAVASSGVVVSFIFGFALAWFLGWGTIEAAFLGAVLTATSVGLTVRALVDIGKLHAPVGVAILEAAVIDDILGIMILSVLSGAALGSLSLFGVSRVVALMVIFIVLVLLFGLKILPGIMRFIGRFNIEEVILSLTIVIIFLVSALSELVSLAAITGAFLAGMVMSRLPVAKSLRAKITTIGYALFIPIFFTEMGVRMNFGELASIGILVGSVVIVMSFISKILGCGVGALIGGFSAGDSLRVGVGMVPRGEVALVIAAIGVKSGVVSHSLLSLTVLIVLATTVVAPLLIKYSFRIFRERG